MDWAFNITMMLFGLLCVWLAWDDRIHTGLLGSIGFAVAGVQSARIMDDSVLHSVDGTQSAVMILVVSLMVAIGNVLYSMWRAGVFTSTVTAEGTDEEGGVQPAAHADLTPRRRRTDFGALDDGYGPG